MITPSCIHCRGVASRRIRSGVYVLHGIETSLFSLALGYALNSQAWGIVAWFSVLLLFELVEFAMPQYAHRYLEQEE